MRPRKLNLLITLYTKKKAIAMKKKAKECEKPGRLVPVPKTISSGCEMAWFADIEYKDELNKFIKELSYKILESLLNINNKVMISEDNISKVVVSIMNPLKNELDNNCDINTIQLTELVMERFGNLIIPKSEYLCSTLFNQLKRIINIQTDPEFNYSLFKALAELMKLCNCYNIILLQWEKALEPLLISSLNKSELACYSFQLLGTLLSFSKSNETSPQHNVVCYYVNRFYLQI